MGKVTKANLVAELNKLIGEGNYTITPNDEIGPWTVTVIKTGYTTTISGAGSLQDLIKLTQLSLSDETLELEEGKEAQLTVTKTPENSNEEFTFTSSNTEIATVDSAGKVIAVAEGTATITVSGKISTDVTGTCTVTVTKPAVPEIGDYVTYGVSYTDMYSNYEYTTSNGWRILDGGTPNGDGTYSNVKLISTGIPALLNYNYNVINTVGWWGTDDQVKDLYGSDYATGYRNYANRYAAAGLIENFELIPFIAGTSASKNEGCFTKINSINTGNITGSIFKATGASEVHNLTLEELNTARGLALDSATSTQSKDGDTGLFYLRGLSRENTNFNNYTSSYYWLAKPETYYGYNMYHIDDDGSRTTNSNTTRGVRVVVSLSSKIQKDEAGNWEIVVEQ